MPRAACGDVEIEYDVAGFYDDDPPLVLIAGLGCQLTFFEEEMVQGLVDRAFRVIRMDNRDAGLSTTFDNHVIDLEQVQQAVTAGESIELPYTLSDMAADVVAVLDDLGIDGAHLLGVSLGGMIAQTVAIEHPSRVRSLTLLSSATGHPSAGQPSPEALGALLAPVGDPDNRHDVVEANVRSRAVWATTAHWDEAWTRAHFAECFDRANHPTAMARQLAAVLAAPDREPQLAQLDVPTVVLHGTDDRLVAPSGGERLADVIPGAELVELDDMGHDLPPHYWAPVIEAVTQLAIRAG
jgi:pimeloyl-ACP methyl ester carboxylesterase